MTLSEEHHIIFIYVATPTAKQERLGHDINAPQVQRRYKREAKQDVKAHFGDKHFWVLLVHQKYRAPLAIEAGQA